MLITGGVSGGLTEGKKGGEKDRGGGGTIQRPVRERDPQGIAPVPAEMSGQVGADGLEDDGGDEADGVFDGVGFFLEDGDDVGHEGGAVADGEGPV